MSWDRLTRTVPPATRALTPDQVKRQLRIETADQDAWIDDAILAAEAYVDGPRGVGLALITQTWVLRLDAWPAEIRIPITPLQTISGITYTDLAGVTQTLATDQYAYDIGADPVCIRRAFGAYWPPTQPKPGAIAVTFVAGFGLAAAVPADIKHALLMLISHLDQNREAVAGIGSLDRPADVPFGTKAILERYGAGRIS